MFVNRREFQRSASMSASVAFPMAKRLPAKDAAPGNWRTFEVTTRIEILESSKATRVWLPAALMSDTPFRKTLLNRFSTDGGTARMVEAKASDSES